MSRIDDIQVDRLLADLAGLRAGKMPRAAGAGPAAAAVTSRAATGRAAAAAGPVAGGDDDRVCAPRPDLRAMTLALAEADPDRLPWPDRWFEANDVGDARLCRALWVAVLRSCLRGAMETRLRGYERAGFEGSVPALWIGSRDFHMVCALAGFDGVAVSDRMARIAADPKRLRDFVFMFGGGDE